MPQFVVLLSATYLLLNTLLGAFVILKFNCWCSSCCSICCWKMPFEGKQQHVASCTNATERNVTNAHTKCSMQSKHGAMHSKTCMFSHPLSLCLSFLLLRYQCKRRIFIQLFWRSSVRHLEIMKLMDVSVR